MNLVLDGHAGAAKIRRYDFELGHDQVPPFAVATYKTFDKSNRSGNALAW
jgi:hypothetical protein